MKDPYANAFPQPPLSAYTNAAADPSYRFAVAQGMRACAAYGLFLANADYTNAIARLGGTPAKSRLSVIGRQGFGGRIR